MYTRISDFIKDWELEKDLTLKIFRNITDTSLLYKSFPEGRTIGRIAWHITSSVSEMGRMSGIGIDNIDENFKEFTAGLILDQYEHISMQLLNGISGWSNDKLNEEIDMYGEKWTRGYSLLVLVRHQIHHRAQLTILMRETGLKVPGTYGPSREEWTNYNMQPME